MKHVNPWMARARCRLYQPGETKRFAQRSEDRACIHKTRTMQYCLMNARTLSTELLNMPDIQHAVRTIQNVRSFKNSNKTWWRQTIRGFHQSRGRPGEQVGWTWRTLIIAIHLVEQVHNFFLVAARTNTVRASKLYEYYLGAYFVQTHVSFNSVEQEWGPGAT